MFRKNENLKLNQKGFTLIEILVVISIIAILFVVLLPQIDFAGDKARQTAIKNDFHTFQIAAEAYMRETAGNGIDDNGLYSFLDKEMKPVSNSNGTTGTVGLDLKRKDTWGNEYDLFIYQADKAIVLKSFGKDGKQDGNDNYHIAIYYDDGKVVTCTSGFETNNIESDAISKSDCGLKKIGGGDFTNAANNPITY